LNNRDITIFGTGQQTRSFCYVDDLVDGIIRLMSSDPAIPGPMNLGNPVEFTILGLAQKVIEITGSRSRIIHHPLPQDDPQQRCPDISAAQKQLGWSPKVQLEEGLKLTIRYFDSVLRNQRAKDVIASPAAP
jgi:UDP-glucuronate decarboxylase